MITSDIQYCINHISTGSIFDQYRIEVKGRLLIYEYNLEWLRHNNIRIITLKSGTKIEYYRNSINYKVI